MAVANLWLFGGIVRRMLEAKQETNAVIRTTTAVTVISGGVKDNILPREAKASVNFRLLPGDRIEDVVTHVRRVIDDERVHIRRKEGFGSESSPLSPTDAPAYQNLERVIRQVFGDIPVAPYLVLGATDARHYVPICDHVYRFSPVPMTPEDLERVHGINERIDVEDMARMVKFFGQLIRVWGSETLEG
jgi:carboxypeptidase PM20D1